MDAVFLVVTVLFFALCLGYLAACERLRGDR